MKFRSDFVTNSSSTSFLVIIKKEFTLEYFLSAFGVTPTSPFADIFERFYDLLLASSKQMRFIEHEPVVYERRIRGEKELLMKASEADQKGYIVKHGTLSSESEIEEVFLSVEPFEIIDECFEIHALSCFW